MTLDALHRRIATAFAAEAAVPPAMTLRSGDALDGYAEPIPLDPAEDTVTAAYLEAHVWGVPHLDPASWRHYLPFLLRYTLDDREGTSLVSDATLQSLRPPDREPPRLSSLSPAQEAAVRAFLEQIGNDTARGDRDLALQALGEWWGDEPLYRMGD